MIFDFLWIYFNFFFQNLVISRFLQIYQREFVSLPKVYEKQEHRQSLLGVWGWSGYRFIAWFVRSIEQFRTGNTALSEVIYSFVSPIATLHFLFIKFYGFWHGRIREGYTRRKEL